MSPICWNHSRGGSTKRRRRRKTLLTCCSDHSCTLWPLVVWVLLLLVPAGRGGVNVGVAVAAAVVAAAAPPLRINEFLASNQNSGWVDFQGDAADWIELYNDGALPVNLAGYALTDDVNMWNKWTFPIGTSIQSKAYLMIFASGKGGGMVDTGDELHTNFGLKADREYLGLYDTTGTVVSDFAPNFPPQTVDVSYGYDITGNALQFFSTPTPNGPNVVGGGGSGGPPQPVQFSVPRGFYTIPFSLVLTATPVTLQIRYTLDGSKPTATSGILYTGPIAITTTSIVRASSFGANTLPEPKIPTHTYIFLADVLRQPAVIPGFPHNGKMVNTQFNPYIAVPLDFAMDPAIVQEYGDEMLAAMTAVPTMSITSDVNDMFGEDGGFYYASDAEGAVDIENEVSVEVLYNDEAGAPPPQQVFAGGRAHSWNLQKRAMRLYFRSEYGTATWTSDIFKSFPAGGNGATNQLRRLILRSGNNRCWARSFSPNETTYTLDQFIRSTQLAMSGYASHGTYVHLYMNGVYEGLYNLVERPDDSFGAAYFGGNEDHWHWTNHNGSGSKDATRWKYLTETLAFQNLADPAKYAELQQYLDVVAFADYMILNFYVGMTDWPYGNWYVVGRNADAPEGPLPARFVVWDAERSLDVRRDTDRQGATIQNRFLYNTGYKKDAILNLWHAARTNRDFREMFYARIKQHTAAGGPLSVNAVLARWNIIIEYVEVAVIGESARWGDSLKSLGESTKTRDETFNNQAEKIRVLLATNTNKFLEEVKYLEKCDTSLVVGAFCGIKGIFFWFLEILGLLQYGP